MFLDVFQGVVAGIWVNLWKLFEGLIREMVLYFESISSEKGEVSFAKTLSTWIIIRTCKTNL